MRYKDYNNWCIIKALRKRTKSKVTKIITLVLLEKTKNREIKPLSTLV